MSRTAAPALPIRRSPNGCLFTLGLVVMVGTFFLLMFGVIGALVAQEPATAPKQLGIYADTAGVAAIGREVYLTWIYAKASPTALPSSGVLVAFDCKLRRVKRLAQVKYRLRADSLGVEGDVQEVHQEWREPVIPRLFDTICGVGRGHDMADPPPPPNPKPWYDPKDHRV